MRQITERVAYLKGMVEGLDLGRDSKEGKIINSMIEVMDELAHTVNDLHHAQSELETYVETLDEDLYDLEDEVYIDSVMDDNSDSDDEEYVEVECPTCHESVVFDPEVFDEDDLVEITCPSCDTVVFVNDDHQLDSFDHGTMDI